MTREVIDEICAEFVDYRVDQEEWDYDGFNRELEEAVLARGTSLVNAEYAVAAGSYDKLEQKIYDHAVAEYEQKIAQFQKNAEENGITGADFGDFERRCMLKTVDEEWIEHIDAMDDLKQSVGLVSYAHQDPVLVYKKEGFEMFDHMVRNIHRKLVRMVFKMDVRIRVQLKSAVPQNAVNKGSQQESGPAKREQKVGRNDPCPCGSGKKYKNCCGR